MTGPDSTPVPSEPLRGEDQQSTESGSTGPDPLRCLVGVYAGLTVVGLGMVGVRGGWPAILQLGPGHAAGESLAWGLSIATLTLSGTALTLGRAQWMRRLGRLVRRVFAPITPGRAVVLGIASAVGEEVLFRGGLQPWLGLPATSVIFGALHLLPPLRRNWPWSVFATVLGFALGWAYQRTGSLLGPIVAHALINAVNLHRCGRL